jgi:hypothetical protein
LVGVVRPSTKGDVDVSHANCAPRASAVSLVLEMYLALTPASRSAFEIMRLLGVSTWTLLAVIDARMLL